VIRRHLKDRQYLIQHRPVLGGYADLDVEVLHLVAQMEQDGTQLDGFRPGSEDEQELGHKD
jgi:hypothetical protein